MIPKKRFEILSHPSDVGLTAYGRDLKEVFQNAAAGLFALMTDLKKVERRMSFEINLTAPDKETLLVNWLSELIYLQDSRKVLLNEFQIAKIDEFSLTATAWGEKIDPGRHLLARPVKAATYNQLMLKEEKGIWTARVVLDV